MCTTISVDCQLDSSVHLPGQDVHDDGDADVSGDHVQPHFQRERREEREEGGSHLLGLLVEDGDAQVHEGHREVHSFLPLVVDSQVCDGHVRLLLGNQTSNILVMATFKKAECADSLLM